MKRFKLIKKEKYIQKANEFTYKFMEQINDELDKIIQRNSKDDENGNATIIVNETDLYLIAALFNAMDKQILPSDEYLTLIDIATIPEREVVLKIINIAKTTDFVDD